VLVAHSFGDKVPKKTVNMIKGLYERFQCQVVHEGKLTDFFEAARLRHGYILSLTLFLSVLNNFMNKVIRGRKREQWRKMERLKDLHFADDSCLLA
jgi:hypothetical protein